MTGAEFSASILGLTVHTADIIARKFDAAISLLNADVVRYWTERDTARSERDASITACEKLSKELQAARADRDEDRFLLGEVNAEVARLREENAALGGHLLSLGVERDRDVSRATNALGRAHAALRQQVITADTHGSCGLCETKWTKNEWHRNGCVLADPTGRAAAEYVKESGE